MVKADLDHQVPLDRQVPLDPDLLPRVRGLHHREVQVLEANQGAQLQAKALRHPTLEAKQNKDPVFNPAMEEADTMVVERQVLIPQVPAHL